MLKIAYKHSAQAKYFRQIFCGSQRQPLSSQTGKNRSDRTRGIEEEKFIDDVSVGSRIQRQCRGFTETWLYFQ